MTVDFLLGFHSRLSNTVDQERPDLASNISRVCIAPLFEEAQANCRQARPRPWQVEFQECLAVQELAAPVDRAAVPAAVAEFS